MITELTPRDITSVLPVLNTPGSSRGLGITMGRAREPIEEEPMDTEPAGGDGLDLSDRDREMLAFERQWWRYAGAKEQAIRRPSASRRPGTTSYSGS
ncbi:hypothetical protein GCM10027612_85560 [Microbispora bryophytorum subsp. camponoti]